MINWWRKRRARARVILAAKCVESSYEPGLGLKYEHDPDDLFELRMAVQQLRTLENGGQWLPREVEAK